MAKKRKLKRPAMPGAGRPATYSAPRKISLLVEAHTLDRLDARAGQLGLRRTSAVAMAIERWLSKQKAARSAAR